MAKMKADVNAMTLEVLEKWRGEYSGYGSLVTASGVTSAERKILLNKRHREDVTIPASGMVKALVGSLVHMGYMMYLCDTDEQILDIFHNRGTETQRFIMEKRYTHDYRGHTLSAQCDIYVKEYNALVNLKANNTGKWLWNDDEFNKEVWQLNTEAALMELHGIPVDRAIVRFLFTDWTPGQLDKNEGKNFPSGLPFPHSCEDYEVKLMDTEDVWAGIYEKADRIIDLMDTPDDELPYCPPSDTGEKPPWKVYALKKDGKPYARCVDNGSFYSKEDAETYRDRLNKHTKKEHVVQYVQNLDRPLCRYYCDARDVCNQWKEFIEGREKEVTNNA